MTKVVHCKEEPYDIYIGRIKDVPYHFGNPFKICAGCSREESIKMFRLWLLGLCCMDIEPRRRKWILLNMYKLKGKVLGCWCRPEACHGDVYVEMLENKTIR